MPGFKVPSAQPRVSRAPLPGVRQQIGTSPADFGGIQADVISKVGRQISGVGEEVRRAEERGELLRIQREKAEAKLQEEDDKMNATASILEFQEAWFEEKPNLLGALRLEAIGTKERALKWYNETKNDILSRAKTGREKELITAKLGTELIKILSKSTTHQMEQRALAKVELNDSVYANAVRSAGSPDSNEVDRVDAELKATDALNQKYEGYDAETAKRGVAEGMSAYHEAVIQGKLVVDLPFAKQYFDDTKDVINPDERENLRQAIRKEDISQTSRAIAKEIELKEDDMLKWQGMVDEMTDDDDISKKAKSILDGKKRDNEAHTKQIKIRELDDLTEKILNAPDLSSSTAIANEAFGTQRLKLLGVAEGIFKEKTSKIVTNPKLEESLNRKITMGEIKTPNQYIREAKGEISTSDIQKGLKFLAQGGEVGDIKETALRSKFREIMDIMPREDPYLYKLARDFIVDQIQATGKPPTSTNIDDWMGQALLTGVEAVGDRSVFDVLTFGIFAEERQITVIEALERGIPFTTEITEDEKKNIILDIQAENATRPINKRIPISADRVEIIFLRDQGFTESQIKKIMGL